MTAAQKWQEWASFALGLWLAVSPWLTGYAHHEAATANAALVGLGLALGAHYGVSFGEAAVQWPVLAAGAWLMAAPFACGFAAAAVPTSNSVAVGACVAALAASALELDKEIGKWWHGSAAGH